MSLRALEIARSAIVARQTEIEMIGHNVANAQTPGYSRRAVLVASVPGETGSPANHSGLGVEVTGVRRLGNGLLRTQVDLETGKLGRETVLSNTLKDIEEVAAGTDGQGLVTQLNAFFDAFSQVAADPAATSQRHELLAAAESLCDAVGEMDAGLRDALSTTDSQLVAGVKRVNQLAAQVAQLNTSIGLAGGEDQALDLVEQRDSAVRELSQLCGSVAVGREPGQVDVLIGGHPLVQGAVASELELTTVASDIAGCAPYHAISFRGQQPPDGLGGELAGRVEARSELLKPALESLSSLVSDFAQAVNTQHRAGYDLDGSAGLDLFTYDVDTPAQTLALNSAIAGDTDKIAAADKPGESGNGANATALEALRNSAGIVQSHIQYLGTLGTDVQSARSRCEGRQAVIDSLDARYQEVASVSLDEEALRLGEAQQGLTAAQRVVQTVLTMIDDLLRL
ncbi:flagellar hook-associated protein FlgK [bacterium]|nr:flagellar hook-associated protein FlgK [bacterium]